ncbi:MAG: hypothetical protein RL477_7 [Pseudomonadota bacterium]|jgi:uncharacterized membrane protein YczE
MGAQDLAVALVVLLGLGTAVAVFLAGMLVGWLEATRVRRRGP